MSSPAKRARSAATVLVFLATVAIEGRADDLVRARITIDASTPPAVDLGYELTWNATGGKPRTELAFLLARGLEVTAVESEGAALAVRGEDVEDSLLRRWHLRLPVPLPPGASRSLQIKATLRAASAPGISVDGEGGFLLPGSGWFPAIGTDGDERPPHTTDFRLPADWRGVACGTPAAEGSGWTAMPGRPYAVWGRYRVEEVTGGGTSFSIWHRNGSGPVPRLETVARLIDALATGVGEAPGQGSWKLVDVDVDRIAGGQRTLFWHPSAVDQAGSEPPDPVDRDLAEGLAEAHWQEAVRSAGPQAAFLAGGIARYLGDAAALTLDRSDDHWRAEARIHRTRRDAFNAARSGDRALTGLSPHSPHAAAVLDGRGALVAHMAADAAPSAAHWVSFLRDLRAKNAGGTVTGPAMWASLDERFPRQHTFLKPFLESTRLPDFVVAEHGPSEVRGQVNRYRIDVENKGAAPGYVEVAIYASNDRLLRSTRLFVPAGGRQSVLFSDARRVARIRLDPRCTTLQSDYANETVDVAPAEVVDDAGYRPLFPVTPVEGVLRRVPSLDFPLDDVTVKGFSGSALAFETHHGPSGAVLLGRATIEIVPRGRFAESMRSALGTDRLSFPAEDLFLRFPVTAWPKLSESMAEPLDADTNRTLSPRRQFVYEHSFPLHMSDGKLAQVPPPGSALVIFCLGGEEWRGFLREPLPDGRTRMRLWDHLRGKVLWEAIL